MQTQLRCRTLVACSTHIWYAIQAIHIASHATHMPCSTHIGYATQVTHIAIASHAAWAATHMPYSCHATQATHITSHATWAATHITYHATWAATHIPCNNPATHLASPPLHNSLTLALRLLRLHASMDACAHASTMHCMCTPRSPHK